MKAADPPYGLRAEAFCMTSCHRTCFLAKVQQPIENRYLKLLCMNATTALFLLTCTAALALKSCPLGATEFGFQRDLWRVNLVGSRNADGQWRDPRGLLSVRGPELGLSAQEVSRLRKTVGDVVCPGTQGTAFLVGQGRTILTNAHIFVDENGNDRANIDKCFWQNKDEPFQRIPVEVGEHSLKLFTRSTAKEFYWDLAVARLEQTIPGVQPLPFDTPNPVEIGAQLIMVSATQRRMPSLPKPETEFIRGDPAQPAFAFDYSREPIVQGCSVMAVGGPADTVPNDTIYSNCSATKGSSGSPMVVRSQTGELAIKGVHVGGGQDAADYTEFTLDQTSPMGRSYSNAIQLNQDILGEIRRFEANE
jgi:V8-like Glu-specific endopeptidase